MGNGNHVVFFSSGAASFVAALRVAKRYGTENLYLVFADTGIEDENNYRFLREASEIVGGQLVWLKDGRTPWDIYFENKWLSHRQGKTGCSHALKVQPCEKWIQDQAFSPKNTTLYFGIGFEEIHRLEAIARNWDPFKVDAPLCWDDFGWADRQAIMKELDLHGIKRPRLYDLGFAHANCGGFCVKAGLGHYRNLLNQMPDRYAYREKIKQKFQEYIGRDDVAILRRTVDSETKGVTLKEWRETIESEPDQLSLFDEALGGCNCFVEED